MPQAEDMRVLVAVPTFRRLDLLGSLLPELVAQAAEARADGCSVQLVVIDNDEQQSARAVVSRFAGETTYRSEPRPGLATVRNAALDAGLDADLLAFIDDDERPAPHWLVTLVRHWHRNRPAAVLGPVVSEPELPVDAWTDGTGILRRPRHATGTARQALNSGNLLLDLNFLREHSVRFDEAFGLTGGEDSLLGKQLVAAGGTIEWCDEAIVTERVPAARQNKRWIRQRMMRQGETWARVRLRHDVVDPSAARRTRVRFVASGLGNVAMGALGATRSGATHDERARGAAEARAWGGIGVVRGSLGLNREMYHR